MVMCNLLEQLQFSHACRQNSPVIPSGEKHIAELYTGSSELSNLVALYKKKTVSNTNTQDKFNLESCR